MANIHCILMVVVLGIHKNVNFLKLEHHLQHSSFEKSIIIERTIIQYVKDGTECFDDLFSLYIKSAGWNMLCIGLICLFVDMHNG